ncbi:hypothetical protein Nepgr_029925 [Nepenthes gracilis]|uniref:DUF7725 domain-containing protein n=1 Tax=Nepenthes gracilis TaxID=150966 RepID=A0AAD3TG82_NEPGR|nr:hypothetical protein Nepgr_029925 [Nepenthes gracilis]
MEAAGGVAATTRSGSSLPLSSSQLHSQKEWRAVSENSVRSTGNEEFEGSKEGKSDERTVHEVLQGRLPLDVVGFCSTQMDGVRGLDDEMERQRLRALARRKEELQQVEIELSAHMIARSKIMRMKNSFDAQMKEQSNVATKLQEKLHETEQTIQELERKMGDKERELHAIRLDNEAAWAKEDLLREQNKELANFRKDRDNIEAERAHHIKQIRDLQEHNQDKERQLMELQEQNRIAQDTILYKDEQLREAQSWISRVQEMDALQSSTNHSLQAVLLDRTEQYNQLWLGCQRQFVEMERHHMQTFQQLQLELACAREKSGSYSEQSRVSQTDSIDVSPLAQHNGSHLEAKGCDTAKENTSYLPIVNSDNSQPFVSSGNLTSQINQVPCVPITPPLFGVPSYLSCGQVTSLHPYIMHQQGTNQSVSSLVSQSHDGNFQSMSAISSLQQWPSQQVVSEGAQMATQNQFPLSWAEENFLRSDSNYGYKISVNGHGREDNLNVDTSQGMEINSVVSAADKAQALQSISEGYLAGPQGQHSLQQISSQFRKALRLDTVQQNTEIKVQENDVFNLINDASESRCPMKEHAISAASPPPTLTPIHPGHFTEATLNNAMDADLPDAFVSTGLTNSSPMGDVSLASLLDERSLLGCIVRTIPVNGKIRISSTLPNRLGKMLAPLHWHDYKKKYGKLDEFLAGHPELFVIEGDYIQLQEGAQGIIAATAAVAKVAAAAAAPSPYLSVFPSAAVTPIAQANRLKKVPSVEPKPAGKAADSLSNVKILMKSKDSLELNGSESRPGPPSIRNASENGAHSDNFGLGNSQIKGPFYAKTDVNFVGKQQGRPTEALLAPRRYRLGF